MNVDGVSLVVVVTWATRGLEERSDEVAVTVLEILLARVIPGGFDVALGAIQIVAGVKIVDPMILRLFPVPPCAVRQLTMTAIAHSFTCDFQELPARGVFPSACEQRRT